MSDAELVVMSAGAASSIQDGGRPGHMRFGVPASGPMDRVAAAAANVALGNPAGAACVEVSTGGILLECRRGAVSVAVAGSAFVVDRAGVRGDGWTVDGLAAGETLTIRSGAAGNWCYVAFAGALASACWLGSAATHAMSGLGGGPLVSGDVLTIRDAALRPSRHGGIPRPAPTGHPYELRAVIGPQERFFDADTLAAFAAAEWRTTDARDRMGTRLAGPGIAPRGPLDMPSDAIVRGAVQVAGDGVATVLLADHQTTGGYPRIATLIDADTDRLAQRRPADAFRFALLSPAEAIAHARRERAGQAAYLAAVAACRGSLAERLHAENLISGVVAARG